MRRGHRAGHEHFPCGAPLVLQRLGAEGTLGQSVPKSRACPVTEGKEDNEYEKRNKILTEALCAAEILLCGYSRNGLRREAL